MVFVPLQAVGDEPASARAIQAQRFTAAAPQTLLSDTFEESASTAGTWLAIAGACLTAGTSSTPSTSLPACGTSASQDAAGSGALQLTPSQKNAAGMIVAQTPLPTANGLVVTFSYAAYDGSSPGADGITSFLTDASKPMPTAIGNSGGSLGYSGAPGISNAYLGIGFDAFGDYSLANSVQTGGPKQISNTIALRGIASGTYPYLGGYTSGGTAASLPFKLDAPTVTTRPTAPPTIQETLTAAGLLTVAIDQHTGSGYVTYVSQQISGTNGETAVPANVYLGFTGSTGAYYERHLITGLTVTTINAATPAPTATPTATPAPTATSTFVPPVANDAFSEPSSAPYEWNFTGAACLTAGTASTPTSSIPACGSAAAVDATGQGALQLTRAAANTNGFVVGNSAFFTAGGIHITFTDNAFGGTSPGGNGVVLFLSDESKTKPAGPSANATALGYGNAGTAAGLANAYLGIALDEAGGFSDTTSGSGGPGSVPETIAVRGAATDAYAYLGGYTNAAGKAASLPAAIDAAGVATRPANAPTVDVLLSGAGLLTVSLDRHDGNGLVPYYSKNIVGISGQPALPKKVFVGLIATTGSAYEVHQIDGFSIAAAPSPQAATAFSPTSVANLQAWYDASNAASMTLSGSGVASMNDLSGKGNTLTQPSASAQPALVSSGIDGRGSLSFALQNFLTSTNAAFSTSLFNESTVFVVTNQNTSTQTSSVVATGPYLDDPRWDLRLTEDGVTHFDFNTKENGRLAVSDVPTGPAIWTAAGSISQSVEQLRKDGNTLGVATLSEATTSGNYPFVVGGGLNGSTLEYAYGGQIGEIVVYNRMLTTAESESIEGYLACKWGLQNRLPANHPYRTSCPQGGTSVSMPIPTPSPSALIDPTQLRSSNGQLVFNVVASQASSGNPQLTYNGSSVPPTLRVLPGDTLIVNLTNNLPTPPSGADYLNDTSLHYHGLHVNPNSPGDDSIDLLAMPGQSLHYQINIPLTHPTGLFWYHSHAHGEADRQNLSGMSGALIVDGVSQYVPAVANMPERVLIARDVEPAGTALPNADRNQVLAMLWAMKHSVRGKNRLAMPGMNMPGMHMTMNSVVRGSTNAATRNPYVVVNGHFRRFATTQTASTHCTGTETAVKNWTLNGQTVPSIGIRPGEQQFWRFVNAGSDTYLDLQVDNANMQVVALDGVPLASVGSPALSVSDYIVPPASRIEFILTGPPSGTTAYLRTNCFDSGSAGPAMPAAELAVINPSASLSDDAKPGERRFRRAPQKRAAHTVAFMRRYAATTTLRQQTLTYSDQNTINGMSYDPGAPAQFYAQSGTMEQWTIVNDSQQVHTFHIHQVHFLVDQIVGGTAIEQSNVGQVLDNINVPASTANGPGTVTLTMDFTDPLVIGTFLLHCHILSHEDAGMMSKITIGTAPPMTTNAQSGLTFASAKAAAQTVTITGGQAPYSVNGCSSIATAKVSGASVTVAPVASGSCVLTIADSSGLTANVAVTVTAAAAAMTVSPNTFAFTGPGAAAQSATIAGGTTPYTAAGCSGVATAAISGTTLTVAPSAIGSCSLTIADSASHSAVVSVSVNAPASGGAADNDTFHQNAYRTGWYQAETKLTTTTVASGKFGLIGTLAAPSGAQAFGKVYAQPLFASAETIGGVSHNLVLVATMTDQVYAFDDATDKVVWSRSFINPSAGITQQSYTSTGCQDVNPDIGITSTPVIDRSADRMYVVVATTESGVFHLRLHAISLQNGTDAVTPVEVSASTMLATGGTATTNAEMNFNRTALLEANGNIYVGLGSHCDYAGATIHGWMMAFNASSLAASGTAVDLTNSNAGNGSYLGAIWMSGFGAAADAQGNIYFTTGNGVYDGVNNFGMALVKLPGTLNVSGVSSFAPSTAAKDSSNDVDFGSGGALLIPDGVSSTFPHEAVAGGKSGYKYVLNRDKLGGQQTNDAGAIYNAEIAGGTWGGPAFFQDANGNSYIIYGNGNPLTTYAIAANGVLSVVANTSGVGCLECRNEGSQPIVSSNGTTAGSAVAWALKTPGSSGGTISLYAFDALKMTTLYSGAAGSWTVGSGATYIAGALVSPVVANGRVYVPTDGGVAVFGLSQ